jgi:hypothetical protein
MPNTEPGKQDNLKTASGLYFKSTPFKLRSQSPAKQVSGEEDIINPQSPSRAGAIANVQYGGTSKQITGDAVESVTADQGVGEGGDDVFGNFQAGEEVGAAIGEALTSDVGPEQQKFKDISGDGEEGDDFRSDLRSRIDNANTPQQEQRLKDRLERKEMKDKVKKEKQIEKGKKKKNKLSLKLAK